ncbi:MAG: chitobiase/beta-hexosaminidase C-terminal domain-containing protein, partial [Anaerolineales bacterium]|nr:chitobiase/beta-hexosaminidase C-terminal domain-containing protein [Anaerolineales bacterium]
TAVLLFEPLSNAELDYFAKLVHIFSDQSIPAGKLVTVNEAYQTTQAWWDQLPIIARSINLYPEEVQSLAETFSRAKTRDPFLFIKYDLLEQFDVTAGQVLTSERLQQIEEKLLRFKESAESILGKVKDEILHLVAEIFDSPTHLDVDLQESFRNWFNSLSQLQKDQYAQYHNNDSKPLVKFTSYVNIHDLLFNTLPDAYGFGSVDTWSTNQARAYVQRIKNGKTHIENNAPQVSQLNVEIEGDHSKKGEQILYRGELKIRDDTEDGKGIIYYTLDGSNPIHSKFRQKLSPGETLTVRGNQKIRFVVADEKGNYGPDKTVDVLDEFNPFKIRRGKQVKHLYETVTFAFPPHKEAACATLQSLLSELKAAGLFSSVEELKQEIQKILEQL